MVSSKYAATCHGQRGKRGRPIWQSSMHTYCSRGYVSILSPIEAAYECSWSVWARCGSRFARRTAANQQRLLSRCKNPPIRGGLSCALNFLRTLETRTAVCVLCVQFRDKRGKGSIADARDGAVQRLRCARPDEESAPFLCTWAH